MADTLKQEIKLALADTAQEWTVGGGETWTIISISLCNTEASDDGTFDIYVDTDGSGADLYIYKTQSLPSLATFVHSDKIVLTAAQKLGVVASAGQDIDVLVSYLEQT